MRNTILCSYSFDILYSKSVELAIEDRIPEARYAALFLKGDRDFSHVEILVSAFICYEQLERTV